MVLLPGGGVTLINLALKCADDPSAQLLVRALTAVPHLLTRAKAQTNGYPKSARRQSRAAVLIINNPPNPVDLKPLA